MIITACNQDMPRLLCLPAEIRLQIYELVIPSRVVHVRTKWTGICIPAGFDYICLGNTQLLATTREWNMGGHAVSFGPDMRNLSQTCRQLYEETAVLPFKTYTWSFETAFTLEQWVSMKTQIPSEHKNAVRTVAVPAPGPYRSSERILTNLQEVLLIGQPYSKATVNAEHRYSQAPIQPVLRLKKDKATDTWMRGGEYAKYAKDLFG